MADPLVEQGRPSCGRHSVEDSCFLSTRSSPPSSSVQDLQTVRICSSHAQPAWWFQQSARQMPQAASLEPVSPASSASMWTQSDPPSSSVSLEQYRSAQRAPESADSLSGDESIIGDDPRDYIEEEELYRNLAENELAIVPYGVSLERYLAGVIYRCASIIVHAFFCLKKLIDSLSRTCPLFQLFVVAGMSQEYRNNLHCCQTSRFTSNSAPLCRGTHTPQKCQQ
jgi:hypothetical protein